MSKVESWVNADGFDVYRLRNIADIAALPDEEIDNAIEALKVALHGWKALAAVSGKEVDPSDLPYLDWTCDGKFDAAYLTIGEDDPFFKISFRNA